MPIIRRDGCSDKITIPVEAMRYMALAPGDILNIVKMTKNRLVLEVERALKV